MWAGAKKCPHCGCQMDGEKQDEVSLDAAPPEESLEAVAPVPSLVPETSAEQAQTPPMPPQQQPLAQKSGSNTLVIVGVIFAVLIVVSVGVMLLCRTSGGGDSSGDECVAAEDTDSAVVEEYSTLTADYAYDDSYVEGDAPMATELADLCIETLALELNERHMGKEFYDSEIDYSSDLLLKGEGDIDGSSVWVDVFMTTDGQLYGRYQHENGTRLDLNGYVCSDGSLYIQLGHESQKSEWRLSPSGYDGNFHYQGSWGKKGKPSRMEFRVVREWQYDFSAKYSAQ